MDYLREAAALHNPAVLPFSWEQLAVLPVSEPLVEQQNHTRVLRRPDHAACRLQYFIHSRIAVGIIEAVLSAAVKILL